MTSYWRPLKAGDVFRRIDGSHWYVEYVNSSGAYVVPLSSVVREINGRSINFQPGGTTISANAVVQILHPLELGGHSQEYANYVKLVSKHEGEGMAKRARNAKGTALGEFEDRPLTEIEAEANTVAATTETDKETGMAKKAKSNGAVKAKRAAGAKREKTPKTVRKCVCGCGGETTGYFQPGHDARFHGWIKKLASGKMGPSELPASVRKGLDLVETKEGFRAKAPHYYKQEEH
jgi:hypothetical protein